MTDRDLDRCGSIDLANARRVPEPSRHDRTRHALADALGFDPMDEPTDPDLFEEATRRVRAATPAVLDDGEVRALPDGCYLMACDVHGKPFNGDPPFALDDATRRTIRPDMWFLLLYRPPEPQEWNPTPGTVIKGRAVSNLAAGVLYTAADADGRPCEYGVIFQAKGDGLPMPSAVEADLHGDWVII